MFINFGKQFSIPASFLRKIVSSLRSGPELMNFLLPVGFARHLLDKGSNAAKEAVGPGLEQI